MVDKLSLTKKLAALDISSAEASAPQRSRLPVMPFATLLPSIGSLNSLYEQIDFFNSRLEQLMGAEGDNSKEISMLQQVLVWLKMGSE